MSFLAPLALSLGLLAVPIILLYMLRLRRREAEVSSTYLWQLLLQDKEANAPWQRLRRNLLLLLQLIILALLVLALMRPFIEQPTVTTGQTVLLLDASASMNATDVEPSRWAAAQQEALNIINTLGPTDTVTVIRVADVPEVLASATNDRGLLRGAIQNAEPSLAAADWIAALTVAAGGAVGTEDFNVVLISDGGLPPDLPPVPGSFRYVPVGVSGENVAITALAARARAGEIPQVFAEVSNFGAQEAEVILSLTVDGELAHAMRRTIPPLTAYEEYFTNLDTAFTTLSANVMPSSDSTVPDHLVTDDSAWTVYNPPGAGRVLLMTPGNIYLRQALTSLPGIEAFQGDISDGLPTGQDFDLYVLDGWLPEDGILPPGDVLIIDPPETPTTRFFTVLGRTLATDRPRVIPGDPRTQYVNFDNVNILDFSVVTDAPWAETLVSAEGGPLLLAGEVDGRQVAILTFDLHRSDLPLQIAWPVLLANLMQWYTPARTVEQTDLLVGETLALSPPFEADTVRVTRPDGETETIRLGQDPPIYADTSIPGIYTVETYAGGDLLQSEPFAVNLFNRLENFIGPAETLIIGAEQVTEAEKEEIGQLEFWPIVALLALAFLAIEWWLYWRRNRLPKGDQVWASK